jgi:hypothetical protein
MFAKYLRSTHSSRFSGIPMPAPNSATEPCLEEFWAPCPGACEFRPPEDVGIEQDHVRESSQKRLAHRGLASSARARDDEKRESQESMLVPAFGAGGIYASRINNLVRTIRAAIRTDVQHTSSPCNQSPRAAQRFSSAARRCRRVRCKRWFGSVFMPQDVNERFAGIRGGTRPSPMIGITLADGRRQIYAFDRLARSEGLSPKGRLHHETSVMEGCFWGGSLGCDGPIGFE